MYNKEAFDTLIDMANSLQIIPESKQGQALQKALNSLNDRIRTVDELKKIKAELIGKCNHCNCASCVFVSLKDEKCFMKTIINDHISEIEMEMRWKWGVNDEKTKI